MGDTEPPTPPTAPSALPTPGSEHAHTAGDRVRDLIAREGRPVSAGEVAVEVARLARWADAAVILVASTKG